MASEEEEATEKVELGTAVSEDGSTRFMTIRVTPEQEAAMEAFFQINNWALIKEAERAKAQAAVQQAGDGQGTTCIIKDQNGQEITVEQVSEVVELGDPSLEEFAVEEVQSTSQEAASLPQIITVYGAGQAPPHMMLQDESGNMPQIIVQEITLPNHDGVKRVAINAAGSLNSQQPVTRRVVPRGTVKPGDKVHKCHVCGKTFKQSPSFNGHYQSHFGAKPFNCEICNTGFTLKAALVAHMSIHTGNKPFRCSTCGKDFRRKDDMLSHMRTHTGEKPYQCDICGKKFKYRNQIPKHKRMHTGERPYSCNHCEKAFSSNIHLRRHERTHTGERPFKCNICQKAFTQFGHLQAHHRIHTDERPFHCSICGRGFREKKVLKKHETIHTMDKPYKCEVCGKGFLRQSNMELHAVMHNKKPDGAPRQRPRPKKKKDRVADKKMRDFVENVLNVVKVEAGIQTDSIMEIHPDMVESSQGETGKEDIEIHTTTAPANNLAAFVNFAVESQELEQQKAVHHPLAVEGTEILDDGVKHMGTIEASDTGEQYTLVMQDDGSEGYLITVEGTTAQTIASETTAVTAEETNGSTDSDLLTTAGVNLGQGEVIQTDGPLEFTEGEVIQEPLEEVPQSEVTCSGDQATDDKGKEAVGKEDISEQIENA